MYSKFENVPEVFGTLADPLPKAAYAAYIARRSLISDRAEVSDKFILQLCGLASRLLDDSLTYNSCKQQNELVLVSSILNVCFYHINVTAVKIFLYNKNCCAINLLRNSSYKKNWYLALFLRKWRLKQILDHIQVLCFNSNTIFCFGKRKTTKICL